MQNIRIGSLLDKGDAHDELQLIVKRLLQNELHEMGPSAIRQKLQRKKAKDYDNTDANKAEILELMRKNDDSPQDPPSQKPNRPKSFADGNPSDPSDESPTSSNNSHSSEKSNKSGKSVPTSIAPS